MSIHSIRNTEPLRPRMEPNQLAGAIGRNRLLAALPAEAFSLLAPHLVTVPLEKGLVLHRAGGAVEDVWFIHGGLVSLIAAMPDGRSVEVAAIGREGAVGSPAGLGSLTAPSTAVVQLSGSADRIAASRLAALARDSDVIREMMIRCGSGLMRQLQQLVACNALHEVEGRLIRWLLHAADRSRRTIPLTQESLSQLLGVQRTTVTMVCRGLQIAGLIHVGRGAIELRDVDALQHKACHCYHVIRDSTEQTVAGFERAVAPREQERQDSATAS